MLLYKWRTYRVSEVVLSSTVRSWSRCHCCELWYIFVPECFSGQFILLISLMLVFYILVNVLSSVHRTATQKLITILKYCCTFIDREEEEKRSGIIFYILSCCFFILFFFYLRCNTTSSFTLYCKCSSRKSAQHCGVSIHMLFILDHCLKYLCKKKSPQYSSQYLCGVMQNNE